MSHRFCSTRIRSHPLARFALYRMVGTGGGYTRTILGSLGSNLQQPGQPEVGKPQWEVHGVPGLIVAEPRKSRLMLNLFTLASIKCTYQTALELDAFNIHSYLRSPRL